MNERIRQLVVFLYGERKGGETFSRLQSLLDGRVDRLLPRNDRVRTGGPSAGTLPLDEKDAFLITYGDQFRGESEPPLKTLKTFADRFLQGVLKGVHILPFFPYSSDDGFSIIDYREVNPDFGTWDHVGKIASAYRLAADLVLNHCSAESGWFQKYRQDDEKFRRFFINVDPDTDLSMIARPRALPLLTKFETTRGEEHVWTTFSADQVDLNFAEPAVLLEMIDILLFYIEQGAEMVRLDAIAYLWKEIGHPSIHHEKTHAVVKLFRALLDEYAPRVVLLTETNVPHEENVSYFGDGTDEAHMVYQFSLPPLIVDAFQREDITHLREWASSLTVPDKNVTFFNFCASHDGIGLLPAHGILTEEEIDAMITRVKQRGGLVSYKSTPKGDIPYELNVNYRDAVAEKELGPQLRAAKFLASQAIMLSMVGVPGIYVHSLLGSGNYDEGVQKTGMNRSINREKLDYQSVVEELELEGTLRNLIYNGFKRLLTVRGKRKAFHPTGNQTVLNAGKNLFVLLRTSLEGTDNILCIINASGKETQFDAQSTLTGTSVPPPETCRDLLTGRDFRMSKGAAFPVKPYEVLWLAYESRDTL